MKVEKGKRVRIKVKLQSDGKVVEESAVEYFQGGGTMLPGLEKAVEGLEKGAKKEGVLAAKEAFGDPAKEINKTISKQEFPADAELKKGSEFAAKAENGQDVVLVIDKVDGDQVEARLCHPLYNKDIEFSVEVLSITDPTPPPLPGSESLLEEDA